MPAIVLAWAGFRRRWLADDALIITRPVRQIVAGNGPVFNVHERAEAATSTLWQWILVGAHWVTGWDPGKLAVYLGLALSVAGLAIAITATMRLHERLTPRRTVWLAPAGVIVLLAIPAVWDFATSGLEIGLETFWVAVAWWLLVRSCEPMPTRLGFLTALWLGLLPLVRPELVIVTVLFGAAICYLQRPTWQRTLAWVATAAIIPVAYEIFRAGYYGILLPLPALAKEPGLTDWSRGLRYIGDTIHAYWLWIPLALIVLAFATLASQRRRRRPELVVIAAPVAAGLISGVYVAKIGGDWMHARMVLPVIFLLLLPFLVLPMARATGVVAVGMAVWAAFTLSPLRKPFDDPGAGVIQNARLVTIATARHENPVSVADWRTGYRYGPIPMQPGMLTYSHGLVLQLFPMRPGTGYDNAVVGSFLGAAGAIVPLDGYVLDQWNLAYPFGAHLKLAARFVPGHEKWTSNTWVFADMANPAVPLPSDPLLGTTPEAVAAARHAMHCGKLHELLESVRAPLTPSRFFKNLFGSYGRTTLRIPTDPFKAQAKFCGNGKQ